MSDDDAVLNPIDDEDDFDVFEDFDDMDDFEMVESDPTIEAVQDTMESFLSAASVDAVYGEPFQHGDTVILPAAEVLSAAGFGFGSGYGTSPQENEGEWEENRGGGSGGGGGGRVLARPVAVIISSPEGVRVEPVVDVTKVALAALTAAGFMLSMLSRMRKPRRDLEDY